jgi:uncharacterized protein YktB (UPF0637 family)
LKFTGFSNQDFDVFTVDGLDERMELIQTRIQPKFATLGEHFAPTLSTMTGDEMHYHVAKHARRTVNPPKDTWVALASSKRGYKKLPHFQIGLFESHLFVWFAVIYESPIKQDFAGILEKNLSEVQDNIPDHFVWSSDHTQPDATSNKEAQKGELKHMLERLKSVKKAELLCGIHLNRNDPTVKKGQQLVKKIEETYQTLMPLYKFAQLVHQK